ncbi:MAG: alpha/beta hydrolase [Vicingaceae bacterium]
MAAVSFSRGSIYYEVSGKGKTLVFLHGFLESKSIWSDYAVELSKSYRVVCIDLPGHGESSCYGYCHDMEFMAQSVLAVLKTLKIRRYHLIGHSMGGYVSMALAELQADAIRGLCLFHSTSQSDSTVKRKEREKVIRLVGRKKNSFISQAIPALFNTDFKPYKRIINDFVTEAQQIPTQGIIAALEGMKLRADRQIVLKFAPYPVLFIAGKHDSVLPVKKLQAEAKISDSAELIILEHSAHMGFIEEKEKCLQYLKAFFKK